MVPVDKASFRNKVFTDIIRLRCGYIGLGYALNSLTNVLIRRPCEDVDTHGENTTWWWKQRLE